MQTPYIYLILQKSITKHDKSEYKKTPINGSIIMSEYKFLIKLIHIGYENDDFLWRERMQRMTMISHIKGIMTKNEHCIFKNKNSFWSTFETSLQFFFVKIKVYSEHFLAKVMTCLSEKKL